MFTEIMCEICINHFVKIIFTLSCAVVDINLLQINCSQNVLLKMCKKNCTDIHHAGYSDTWNRVEHYEPGQTSDNNVFG
jgi:hypothetical protein